MYAYQVEYSRRYCIENISFGEVYHWINLNCPGQFCGVRPLTNIQGLNTITSLIAAKQMVTTFHNKRRKKGDARKIFYLKNLNFIYSVDKTFWIIRIIDVNRAEPTCYSTNFPYASSGL